LTPKCAFENRRADRQRAFGLRPLRRAAQREHQPPQTRFMSTPMAEDPRLIRITELCSGLPEVVRAMHGDHADTVPVRTNEVIE
jgi:hypothetical protein